MAYRVWQYCGLHPAILIGPTAKQRVIDLMELDSVYQVEKIAPMKLEVEIQKAIEFARREELPDFAFVEICSD